MANLTGQNISSSYQTLVTLGTGTTITDGTGSLITNLAVTASWAQNAVTASFALNAGSQNTGSLMVTGSVSSNVLTFTKGDGSAFNLTVNTGSAITVNTGSLMVTGSATNNVLTFTKGDGSTFNVTVATGSAVTVNTGSLMVTASAALNVITFTKGDASTFAVTVNTGSAVTVNTGSLMVTGSVVSNILTFTKGDGSTFNLTVATGSAVATPTGSLLVTASISNATTTFTKGDGSTFALTANNVVNATSASFATTAASAGSSTTAVSASHAVNANNAISASFASTAPYSGLTGTVPTWNQNTTGNAATATSASHALFANAAGTATSATTATSASHAVNANIAISSSFATTSSFTSTALSASYALTASFLDGSVTSASFASSASYVTGQADGALTGDLLFTSILGEIYGSVGTPITGNLTISATSVKRKGAVAVVFHTGSSEPTVAGGTIAKKVGNYSSTDLNVITFTNVDGTNYLEYIAGAPLTTVVSASFATTASFATFASTAGSATSASFASTASYTPNAVVTASVSLNTITLTKGDGTTFPITVNTGSAGGAAFPFTGSAQITGSLGVTGSMVVSKNQIGSNATLTIRDNAQNSYSEGPTLQFEGSNVGLIKSQAATNFKILADRDLDVRVGDSGTGAQFYLNLANKQDGDFTINDEGHRSARYIHDNLTESGSISFSNTTLDTGIAIRIDDTKMALTMRSGSLTIPIIQRKVATKEINIYDSNFTTGSSGQVLSSNAQGGIEWAAAANTGSLVVTGSVASNVLTFTKGDGSTFNLTVNTGSGGGVAFPFTGSATISGSLDVTGPITSTEPSTIDGVLITTRNVTRTVLVGADASSSPGTDSTYIGAEAGKNLLGNNNTVVGAQAGAGFGTATGNSNTFIGSDAGLNSRLGGLNTAVGAGALGNVKDTDQATAIGGDAGKLFGTGGSDYAESVANSIFIGYNSRPLADAQTNQIVIGHGALGSGSNSVVLGNNSITATHLKGTIYGNGSGLTNVTALSASFATSASFAISASHAVNSNSSISASFATTASYLSGQVSTKSGDLQFSDVIGEIYGSVASPVTGNLTISATSTKRNGSVAVVFHTGSTEPTVTGGTIAKKTGLYSSTDLNVISFTNIDGTNYIETIAGAGITTVASASVATSASYALTASFATFASTAGSATSASFATTASFAANVGFIAGTGANSLRSAPFLNTTPATASGVSAIAIGDQAEALADYSVAIGFNTEVFDASRFEAVAIGKNARTAQYSVSIGAESFALGANATALGYDAEATDNNGIAIGNSPAALSNSSIAVGTNASANGTSTISIGTSTNASSSFAIAVGPSATATGQKSVSIGSGSRADKIGSVVIGSNAISYADNSVIIGTSAQNYDSARPNSVAIGNTAAAAQNAVSVGWGANATSDSSVGIGRDSYANADFSVAIGRDANASDGGSSFTSEVAIGYGARTSTQGGINIGNRFFFNSGSNDSIELRANSIISGSLKVRGSTEVTGSLTVTEDVFVGGSVRGKVRSLMIGSNTASIDLGTGNFFDLTIVSGSNTFIDFSNILEGQTINLKVNQPNPGNGTVSFPAVVKQVSGSAYVPTIGTGATDIVTFIAFDTSSLFLSNVKNLI